MDSSRHGLFRYLTADESVGYLAIMDLFSATLLTDLSAVEVTTQLAERACGWTATSSKRLHRAGNLSQDKRPSR